MDRDIHQHDMANQAWERPKLVLVDCLDSSAAQQRIRQCMVKLSAPTADGDPTRESYMCANCCLIHAFADESTSAKSKAGTLFPWTTSGNRSPDSVMKIQ